MRRWTAGLLTLFIILIIAIAVVFVLSKILHLITLSISLIIYAILILTTGIVLTSLISDFIKSQKISRLIGATASEGLSLMIRIIGYTISIIAVLSLFKIGITSILFGSTAVGLILGLASQDVLSNIFGGIVLFISKPFGVGDRITFTTWQYGLIAPTFPPKYFNNDFLIPGYTGVVKDISLMWTTILTDDNIVMKIPNSIMIQAAVLVHDEEYRRVRTRFEVSKDIDPDLFITKVKSELSELDIFVGEPVVRVIETTLSTYVIVVDALAKGKYEEPIRDQVLRKLISIQKQLLEKTKAVNT